MLTIPAALIPIKNARYNDAPFLLFIKMVVGTDTFRLCNDLVNQTWDGETWAAYPFNLTAMNEGKGQEVPSANLVFANPMRIFQSYLEEYNGTAGGTVTIYVLHADNLASGSADIMIQQKYKMGSATAKNDEIIIELTTENPWRKRCPLNRIRKNTCRWRFKSIQCGYVGAETTCDKTLDRCAELVNGSSYGGFPGVGRGIPGLRI